MRQSIDYAREKLRKRLRELPDGVWREVQYIDHDGHEPEKIYKIVCTLTKKGDAADLRLHRHQPQCARPHQLDLFGPAGRRACRPSTSTCAGTSRGTAACAIAWTSSARAAPSTTAPIRRPARWRPSRPSSSRSTPLGAACRRCCWPGQVPRAGDGGLVGHVDGADLRRHEPARLPVRRDRDEPLRRRRRRAATIPTASIRPASCSTRRPTCRTSKTRNPSIRSSISSAGICRTPAAPDDSAAGARANSPTRSTTRRKDTSRACSPAPARRCPTPSASSAACRGRRSRSPACVKTDIARRIGERRAAAGSPASDSRRARMLARKHTRSPMLAATSGTTAGKAAAATAIRCCASRSGRQRFRARRNLAARRARHLRRRDHGREGRVDEDRDAGKAPSDPCGAPIARRARASLPMRSSLTRGTGSAQSRAGAGWST